MRSAEKRDQHFVYNGFAVANRPVMDRISFLRRQGLPLYVSEQHVTDRHGPFSADPDQRDGAACTRRDGGNRVVSLAGHLPMYSIWPIRSRVSGRLFRRMILLTVVPYRLARAPSVSPFLTLYFVTAGSFGL